MTTYLNSDYPDLQFRSTMIARLLLLEGILLEKNAPAFL